MGLVRLSNAFVVPDQELSTFNVLYGLRGICSKFAFSYFVVISKLKIFVLLSYFATFNFFCHMLDLLSSFKLKAI